VGLNNNQNNNHDLHTEVLPQVTPTVPPTEVYTPAIAPPLIQQPPIQPLPPATQTPAPINRAPSHEPLPQQTVQVYAPIQADHNGGNASNKGLWIALWGGAFTIAIAIGALMATRSSNTTTNTANNSTPNKAAVTQSPSKTPVASPSPSASIEPTVIPTPTSAPTAVPSPTPTTSPKIPITPLSETDAVDIVNNLVASKNQMFAPPFDRKLLAELTTGEAYEKRKGAIDWLEQNNAFYRYGEFTVSRVGAFGIQDNQANVTVEIFESPTLYVNGKIDRTQSQPSRGRYVCTLSFENGKWKIANLTKVD
jgi:serine/threonine-protein kinase